VIILKIIALTVFLSIPSPDTKPIEQAFLQNNPDLLAELFPQGGAVSISLPDPISFADMVSSEQAFFLFRQIFSVYKTTEFFIDPEMSSLPEKPGRIVKTRRWSFRNTRNGLQYPFRIFFYIVPEDDLKSPEHRGKGSSWKILEIRAEKI
jgi:hypothetical protein